MSGQIPAIVLGWLWAVIDITGTAPLLGNTGECLEPDIPLVNIMAANLGTALLLDNPDVPVSYWGVILGLVVAGYGLVMAWVATVDGSVMVWMGTGDEPVTVWVLLYQHGLKWGYLQREGDCWLNKHNS